MSELATRVARGIKFLDEHEPDWRDSVDVFALNMADCDECVFGHIFGGYCDGKDKYNLSSRQCEHLGLLITYQQGRDIPALYKELTAAWVTALQGEKDHD